MFRWWRCRCRKTRWWKCRYRMFLWLEVPLPEDPLLEVPLPDVPLVEVPLPKMLESRCWKFHYLKIRCSSLYHPTTHYEEE